LFNFLNILKLRKIQITCFFSIFLPLLLQVFNLVDLILLNPFGVLADFRVDSGNIVLAAADTPADDSGQIPGTAGLAHQRATTVTLKRIQ
jgi:hypothetical protein